MLYLHGLLTPTFWRDVEGLLPLSSSLRRPGLQIHMIRCLQASKERQYRHSGAREYTPPGRLLFLRPLKHGAKETAASRDYDPVWITAEVTAAPTPPSSEPAK